MSVIMSFKLSWEPCKAYIKTKASKNITILNKARHMMDYKALFTIFYFLLGGAEQYIFTALCILHYVYYYRLLFIMRSLSEYFSSHCSFSITKCVLFFLTECIVYFASLFFFLLEVYNEEIEKRMIIIIIVYRRQ